MRTFTRAQRLIALILLAWYLPSCATARWQTQTIVPQEMKRTMYVGDVRVTTTDGSTHAFKGVWVSADSLGGWLVEPAGIERAFPLASIGQVQARSEARNTSSNRSVSRTLVGFAILGVLVAGVVVARHSWGSWP